MPTRATVAERLSSAFWKFLLMHACFLFFTQIHIVFLNTFILRALDDSQAVLLYNMMLAVVQPFAMICAVLVCRRIGPGHSQLIGFAQYIVAFALLSVLGERSAGMYLLVAALIASAAGFYYTSYSVQLLSVTSDRNRDRAFGIMGIVTGVVALVAPMISSGLILWFGGFLGYQALFGLAFALVLMAAFFSARQPRPTLYDGRRKSHLLTVARAFLRERPYRDVGLCAVVQGFRGGTVAFFVTMLIYQFVHDEWLVGLNATLGGLAAILCNFLYARIVRPETRSRSIFIGATVLSSVSALLFLRLDAYMLIAYNIVVHLTHNFIFTSYETTYMNVMHKHPATLGMGAEVHALREFFLGAGRVLGIGLIMLMPPSTTGTVVVILVLALSQYGMGFFVRDIAKCMKKLELSE